MDAAAIQSIFDRTIEEATTRAGVKLGRGNEFALPELTKNAAQFVSKTTDQRAQSLLIMQGIAAYESLVADMVRAASTIENYPPGIIGEDTFDLAKQYRGGPMPPWW